MDYKITKLSQISNTLFFASIIFCLFFLWCNYYTKNINISFLSSIIVFFAFLILYIPLKIHIKNKKNNIKKNKENLEYFKLQLQYSKETTLVNTLNKYLNTDNFQKISSNHYFVNNDYDLFIYKSHENTKIEQFFTTRISNNIKILTLEQLDFPIKIKDVNITFLDLNDFYREYIEKFNGELETVETKIKPKYGLKSILRIVLCKEKSKNYFWIGFLLLFSSLFTPYSTYYIIFSSILFIMSLISRFNFAFEFKKNKLAKK